VSLSDANGARRETARAWVNGWQYADRVPERSVHSADTDDLLPRNGVLLAAWLYGLWHRIHMDTDALDERLLLIGEKP
jgi:hypothetical protein